MPEYEQEARRAKDRGARRAKDREAEARPRKPGRAKKEARRCRHSDDSLAVK